MKNTRERLWEETGGRCIYCGHSVTLEEMETDHIIPRSMGGEGGYPNLVCSCHRCNAAKADMLVEDFLELSFGERKLEKYLNRLETLVDQQKMSEAKAVLLYPTAGSSVRPEPQGLTEWQTLVALADILIGRLSAILENYGRKEKERYPYRQ